MSEYKPTEKELVIWDEINSLLANYFNRDLIKIKIWLETPNQLTGGDPPRFMIEAGQEDKLLKIIKNQLEENAP